MKSENLGAETAMLRVLHLPIGELIYLGVWLAATPEERKDRGWPDSYADFGLKTRGEHLRIAAAALLLASEDMDKTPFDRWLDSNPTITRYNVNALREAFEAGASHG